MAQGEPSIDLGGDGGDVTVAAGQDIALNAPITLFGTVPDGFGGTADSGSASDSLSGPLTVSLRGWLSSAGGDSVTLRNYTVIRHPAP